MVLVFIPSSRLSTLNTVYSVMFPLYLVFTVNNTFIPLVAYGFSFCPSTDDVSVHYSRASWLRALAH